MVLGKKPGQKLLRSENDIQQSLADKAKEYEADRIFLAGHLHVRIHEGNPIDDSLNWKADPIEYRRFPGEDPIHVPAQGLH